jgi:enterochelin esterase-like enzyme
LIGYDLECKLQFQEEREKAMIRTLFALAMLSVATVTFAQVPSTSAPAILPARVAPLAYRSKVLNLDRDIYVYLPAAYSAEPNAHFPVLYLRHGGDGTAINWIEKGDAPAIFDTLFAKKRAVPMIVVFTLGQLPTELGSTYDAPGLAAAGRELVEDVIPLIESKYRASTGGANRAIAGLSMGAGQSFAIGQAYSNDFSAVGVFSAGTFGVVGSSTPVAPGAAPRPAGLAPPPPLRPFDPARDAAPALADPVGFNRRTPLLYISVGDGDPRAFPTAAAIKTMRERGLRIVSAVQKGKHEWPVWKVALADFVPRLFGGPAASRR